MPWRPDQVAWSIDLPGEGNGSPVLWQDRYYLLSANPQTAKRQLICGDLATGKAIWIEEFPSPSFPIHKLSSFASCTPCVDETGVYAAWATPEQLVVKAFSHEGKELWSRDLGRYVSQHGFGGSPIRVGSLLVLANSQDA
jgi:outer membrane protein assembly factor BamB